MFRESRLGKLEQAQNQILRIILGCFKSTPRALINIETGIYPVKDSLSHHPTTYADENNLENLQYPSSHLPHTPEVEPIPPWKHFHKPTTYFPLTNKQARNSTLTAQIFRTLTENPDPNHLEKNTDGSVCESTKTASCAFYIPKKKEEKAWLLKKFTNSFNAELYAIRQALYHLNNYEMDTATIFTDSLSAIQAISNFKWDSSPVISEIINQIVNLNSSGTQIILTWIPSHTGIPGNETADQLATNQQHTNNYIQNKIDVKQTTANTKSNHRNIIFAKLKAQSTNMAVINRKEFGFLPWHNNKNRKICDDAIWHHSPHPPCRILFGPKAVFARQSYVVRLGRRSTIIRSSSTISVARRNRHVWRKQFSAKKQCAQQSADDWLCELRDLARKCEFQTDSCARCEPTRILGQLIFGVESDEVCVKLLEQETQLRSKAQLQHTGDSNKLQAVHQPCDKTGKPPARDNKPANDKFTGCGNCGSKSQCKPLTACPAQGRKCNKCGRPNHYAQVCRNSKPTPKQQSIYVEPSPPTVGAVKTSDLVAVSITPKKLPTANGEHAGVVVHALPDTGADIDAIPESLYMQKFSSVSLRKGIQPVTAVGSPIVNVGVFSTLIEWTTNEKNSCSLSTDVHVLRELKQPVLSKKSQQALGMLPSGYPRIRVGSVAHTPPSASQQQADLRQLMSEQPKIFDGTCRPMTGPPCHFQLVKNAKPVAMRGSRPVSVPLLPKLKAELDALESAGIVRRVSKPTEWVHPLLVVMKKNGDIRLVIDFRELNECIIRPNFETATPFQAVRTIPPGMRFFTVIDALKEYHQVLLDDPSINLTTFSTPFGQYQYRRLPRIVEDVLIFSATYDEHVEAVRTVFARAAAHNVSINTAKIVFAQPAVTFGGYVVEENGFRPDPALRRAISEFPVPKSITDVRSFFGLCQQVGHFSDQLAAALDPLSPLLKAGYAWEWTTRHDETFCAARKLLSTVQDLAFYYPKRPTSLHVDASRLNGLGFLLKQLDD
ncbi:Uncharacterized protein APZ42_015591 [Daphnia magna]|uniref:RNase H type-1 domain-containing protein n=1 Tax=Daphnia magna TaxID=35525 RepID=A0A162NUH5_9CRUS|nr:Uncharacterized protein APZ42_015591 [Daphnia magna]